METESARQRSMSEARSRILEAALLVLGGDPDAGLGDVALAAGVVRRTIYGHFPSRIDLVRSLVQLAVSELHEALDGATATGGTAPEVWAGFISRVWLLADRYRVLVVLRRSEHGREIHALLKPVDDSVAELVQRGQQAGAFGQHLPAEILGQIAFAVVFNVVDSRSADDDLSARQAIVTSLLTLGVAAAEADELANGR